MSLFAGDLAQAFRAELLELGEDFEELSEDIRSSAVEVLLDVDQLLERKLKGEDVDVELAAAVATLKNWRAVSAIRVRRAMLKALAGRARAAAGLLLNLAGELL